MLEFKPPLNPARDTYTPEALTSCLRALGTLVKALGGQHETRLVVIGGLVPRLLLDDERIDPALDFTPHVGTTDVDLCVEVDVPQDGDKFYQHLQQALEESKFYRAPAKHSDDPSVWRWVRSVDHVTVAIELLTQKDSVTTDLEGTTFGRLTKDEPRRDGDEIGALRIRGAHLALTNPEIRPIEIELLDGAGIAKVDVRVANLLAFVVLKSFAVKHRKKDKDTFDLIWILTYWQDGPAAAARHARSCTGADHPDVADAVALLAQEFETVKHNGCVRYANFSEGLRTDENADDHTRRCREAHATIGAFLNAWHISGVSHTT